MRSWKTGASVAISAVIVGALTVLLWYVKRYAIGPHHPAFFYLPLIAGVAFIYGGSQGVLCVIVAAACSAFFLYDPMYSFAVANPMEWGDLVCFAMLGLFGVKCARELMRPAAKIPTGRSRFSQL